MIIEISTYGSDTYMCFDDEENTIALGNSEVERQRINMDR